MATKTQIINGAFQAADGSVLSNGCLVVALSHDSKVSSPAAQIVAGMRVTVPLDNNGNVAGLHYLWTDDVLAPSASFYTVEAYTSQGLKAWLAPQYWVLAAGSPIDLGTITPTNP